MRLHDPHRARCLALCVALVGAAALGSPSARAADVQKGKPDKGATAGTHSGDTGTSADTTVTTRLVATIDEDEVSGLLDWKPGRQRKGFDVSVNWETHALLWCPGDGTCSSNAGGRKLFNFAYASAGLNLTRNDRIRVRAGFYEYLLADPGESGIRATDLSLSYSHLFRLPAKFALRATVAATAPISFYSQKAGLITSPTASLGLSNSLAKTGLSFELSVHGGVNIQACSSAGGYDCQNVPGGVPNSLAAAGGSLEVDYAFWFHKPLVLGVDGYLTWIWYRNPGLGNPVAPGCVHYGYGCNYPGAVQDKTYVGQPFQQAYGFEVFLRYSMPKLGVVHVDLQLALANGDPTLGSMSRSIDGIARFLADYYSTFEVYGAIAAHY